MQLMRPRSERDESTILNTARSARGTPIPADGGMRCWWRLRGGPREESAATPSSASGLNLTDELLELIQRGLESTSIPDSMAASRCSLLG